MKTAVATALYLLLASGAAYLAIRSSGGGDVVLEVVFLTAGFALVGASAFTSTYSRWWGEGGGKWATIVLRNLLGIPLWLTGFVLAWIQPSSLLFGPSRVGTIGGVFLILAGAVPVAVGHIQLGWRTHMPSVSDTLVRGGLYAFVRHPIYSGGFLMLVGLALIRPTSPFVLACVLGIFWLVVQARLEEIDLRQRLPSYRDYEAEVPRFLPRLRPRGRSVGGAL